MNRYIVVSALLLAGTMGSCTGVVRWSSRQLDLKYAEADSGSVWIVPVPELEPRTDENKTVFIDFKNQSDAQDFDLRDILKNAAQAEGWTVVSSPDKANIRLRARTRFFGEVVAESGGAGTATALGWIAGAAVGGATYYGVETATDSWVAGAAAGAGAGGLAGIGTRNASTPREWALITDFLIEEYHPEGVEFELQSSTRAKDTTVAGVNGPRTTEGAINEREGVKGATIKQKSNYFPHGARLSVWANQMNMQKKEAKPLVIAQAKEVVKQLLP